jgi:hypothetical protein
MPMAESTYFIVCKTSATTEYMGIFASTPSSGNDYNSAGALVIDSSTTSELWILNGGSSTSLTMAESGTGILPTSLISARIAPTGASLYRNGVVVSGDGAYTINANSTGYLVGARYIGGAVDTSLSLNGDIYEILVYPTSLTDKDMQAVEAYLNAKYSIY